MKAIIGEPGFWSLALRDIPRPDFLDVIAVPLPAGTSDHPGVWAEELFAVGSMPLWVRLAMGLRQALVPLLGLKPAPRETFRVREIVGDEALIAADDAHLDFRCGIGVDRDTRLVRVTTAVRLKGRRGRLYFAPVQLAHPVVVMSMLRNTQRRLARRVAQESAPNPD
jgi:hypothetical protein